MRKKVYTPLFGMSVQVFYITRTLKQECSKNALTEAETRQLRLCSRTDGTFHIVHLGSTPPNSICNVTHHMTILNSSLYFGIHPCSWGLSVKPARQLLQKTRSWFWSSCGSLRFAISDPIQRSICSTSQWRYKTSLNNHSYLLDILSSFLLDCQLWIFVCDRFYRCN